MTHRSPDISLILPALKPDPFLMRCLSSITAVFKSCLNYEIILVVPNTNLFRGIDTENLIIVEEDMPGIYGAMNLGITESTGRYLYFIGQDDILLPMAADAISMGIKNDADLIVADVFWGKNKIYKNIMTKKYLAWTNWCHQGIFYDRIKFIEEIGIFPVKYTTQADHYVNIVFSSISSVKMVKYKGCVAWYSANGFSNHFRDIDFREVFPKIVREHIGYISYCCVAIRRAILRLIKLLR